MPEIGEVARIVHYLRTNLLHRTIASCTAYEDDIVYGKVGTSAQAFQSALTSRRVTNAGQQGKYFYLTFDKPPHAVMHLGMTGWIEFRGMDTKYYKQAKEKAAEQQEWPPKYVKFLLKVDADEAGGREAVEVAFVDARRLARIRLVDCEAESIRDATPLKENGPDPVVDREVVTVEWLAALLKRKRVPVKALLLDQANVSGVGNWVADEVLYQARIHPEQYSNTFDLEQIARLHESLLGVCGTAVETLADSSKFPEHWLMKYRWDKGKKDGNVLPSGEKIVHLKVGGRTSAVVLSRQKKTGMVAGDVEEDEAETGGEKKPADRGKKRKAGLEVEGEEKVGEVAERKGKTGGRGKKAKAETAAEEEEQAKPARKASARGERETKAEPKDDAEAPTAASVSAKRQKPSKGPKKSAQAKFAEVNGEEDEDGEDQVADAGRGPRRPSTKAEVAQDTEAVKGKRKVAPRSSTKEAKDEIPGERRSARGKGR